MPFVNRCRRRIAAYQLLLFLTAGLLALGTTSARSDEPAPAEQPLGAVEYPVADLVLAYEREPLRIHLEDRPAPKLGAEQAREKGEPAAGAYRTAYPLPISTLKSRSDGRTLLDLITKTIEPESWSHRGGRGQIELSAASATLYVVQTESVHQEIAELLAQLRKVRPTRAVFKFEQLRLSDEQAQRVFKKPTLQRAFLETGSARQLVLAAEDCDQFRQTLDAAGATAPRVVAQCVIDDRQGAEVVFAKHQVWQLATRISAAVLSVRLALGVSAKDPLDMSDPGHSATMHPSEAWLVDVSGDLDSQRVGDVRIGPESPVFRRLQQASGIEPGRRILLLITVTNIIEDEEESVVVSRKVKRRS